MERSRNAEILDENIRSIINILHYCASVTVFCLTIVILNMPVHSYGQLKF